MRYKPERKEETHRRIIETASREFREKGVDGVGIANLMKKLELTHGGFYAHFENKDDLVRESVSKAFDEVDQRIDKVLEERGPAGVIQVYLSIEHVENTAVGCPVPALASEMSRQNSSVASVFEARMHRRLAKLAAVLPGESSIERVDLAYFILSSMVGAVTIARSTSDPAERQALLYSTQRRLLKMI